MSTFLIPLGVRGGISHRVCAGCVHQPEPKALQLRCTIPTRLPEADGGIGSCSTYRRGRQNWSRALVIRPRSCYRPGADKEEQTSVHLDTVDLAHPREISRIAICLQCMPWILINWVLARLLRPR